MEFMEMIESFSDIVSELFKPELYEKAFGRDDRFPSAVSAVLRAVLRFVPFVLIAIPIVWIVMCIVSGQGIVDIILYAIFGSLYVVVLGVLIILGLCLIESFAKNIACLIQYGELPKGAENPADALVCKFFRGL